MRTKIGTARPGRLRRAVAGCKWSLRQVSLYKLATVTLLVSRMLLFANASKSTRKSTHGTRLCGVAQGLHIVIYIAQKHS